MPDPVATVTMVGTLVGSGVAAFMANRAAKKATSVKAQMDGPGDEPSLREMVRSAHQAGLDQYKDLHSDLIHITDRLKSVETAVNTSVESRLQALEKHGQTTDLVTATLKAIDGRVISLAEECARAALNLHILANVAQVKLLTREEVKAKRAELLQQAT